MEFDGRREAGSGWPHRGQAEIACGARWVRDRAMKTPCLLGLLAGTLLAATLGGAPAKPLLDTVRAQARAVHQSLINDASPQVRAKINAAAGAARDYLMHKPRNCDLAGFLAQDLRTRLPRITDQQLQLLMVLTFAEMTSDAQMANVELQNILQQQQQTLQMLSTISKNVNDTALAVIRKIGG